MWLGEKVFFYETLGCVTVNIIIVYNTKGKDAFTDSVRVDEGRNMDMFEGRTSLYRL